MVHTQNIGLLPSTMHFLSHERRHHCRTLGSNPLHPDKPHNTGKTAAPRWCRQAERSKRQCYHLALPCRKGCLLLSTANAGAASQGCSPGCFPTSLHTDQHTCRMQLHHRESYTTLRYYKGNRRPTMLTNPPPHPNNANQLYLGKPLTTHSKV